MTFEHKPNSGSLFKNDKRETDSQPNAKGSALIDGVAYWVSAWTNTAANGAKYQSLKFSKKEENRAPNPSPELVPHPDDPDNQIPF